MRDENADENCSPSQETYLELYKIEQERYHNSLGYLYSHLKYYYTILAALFVATYFVWKNVDTGYPKGIALILGGMLIAIFSTIGCKLVQSGYRHWLESVTTLAKYEEKLGLHRRRDSSNILRGEIWIFPRYRSEIMKYSSSTRYVDDGMTRGSMRWITIGFVAIGVVAALSILTGFNILLSGIHITAILQI